MKLKIHYLFILPVFFIFVSCKKDNPTDANTGNLRLYRIQEGTDPASDSIFMLYYTGNEITKIVDTFNYSGSSSLDSLSISYDLNGNVSYINGDVSGVSATFLYNGTQLSRIIVSPGDRYAFTYNNGVVSSMIDSTDNGYGTYIPWRTYNYTVSNGNVTAITGGMNASFTNKTVSFGSQPNSLIKNLYLINCVYNMMYFITLGGEDFGTYFSNNLLTGYTADGYSLTINYTYTGQYLTKIEAADPNQYFSGFALQTWILFYK